MAAPISPQYPQDDGFPEYWTSERKDVGVYGKNYLPGRFFSARDMKMLHSVNAELYGDIIEIVVQVFKIAVAETTTNIYGEASSAKGKSFYNAVDLTCIVERDDISTTNGNKFGPDRNQSVAFRFRERDCITTKYFPEVGDLVLYNERYHEIDNVIQEQLQGGHPDKSWSLIVNTHYSRLSSINLVERQT
jgi:hypothetical protein